MKPYDIQKQFFDTILDNSKQIDDPNIQIYQELVLFRFVEVIKSTYPIFTKYLPKTKLENLVKEFIKYGSHTPYIWKIAQGFKEFLFTKDIDKQEREILEFELKQINIYVSNSTIKKGKISYKKAYRLSKNAHTMLYKKEYVLIYKNIEDMQVYYITISKFLYYFFKYQRGDNTINKAISLASKRVGINYKDAKNISIGTIKNFIKNGIMV